MSELNTFAQDGKFEFATFVLDEIVFGINIKEIKEINSDLTLTSVPNACSSVAGVHNLRGDIVTVLNLRTLFGLDPIPYTSRTRNLIVSTEAEDVGLVVDEVLNVIHANYSDIEEALMNIAGVDSALINGVYKTEDTFVVLLNVNEVIQVEVLV